MSPGLLMVNHFDGAELDLEIFYIHIFIDSSESFFLRKAHTHTQSNLFAIYKNLNI